MSDVVIVTARACYLLMKKSGMTERASQHVAVAHKMLARAFGNQD